LVNVGRPIFVTVVHVAGTFTKAAATFQVGPGMARP
jgi:hypothetical protein